MQRCHPQSIIQPSSPPFPSSCLRICHRQSSSTSTAADHQTSCRLHALRERLNERSSPMCSLSPHHSSLITHPSSSHIGAPHHASEIIYHHYMLRSRHRPCFTSQVSCTEVVQSSPIEQALPIECRIQNTIPPLAYAPNATPLAVGSHWRPLWVAMSHLGIGDCGNKSSAASEELDGCKWLPI